MKSGSAVFPETRPRTVAPPLGVSVGWTVAGYVAYLSCQWGILVVLARLGSPESVGEFAIGLAIAAPVILFSNLGLRRLQVADAAGRFLFADYFGLRMCTCLGAVGAIAAIAFASGYGRPVVGVILAMGVAKAVEAASDALHGVLQKGERMDLVAGGLALRGLAGVAGMAIGMAATHRVAFGVLAMAVGWTAVLLGYDLPRASRRAGVRPRWRARTLGRLAWIALPLGLVATIGSLMASVPSVLIEKIRGAAELGVYTALAYAYAAGHRIATAMGEAASARLARHHAAGRRREFLRVLGGLVGAAGAGAFAALAIVLAAGRPLLTVLYGAPYGDRADILAGLMLVAVAGLPAIVLDYGMTAMGRLKVQPLIHGAALLLYASLCARFIPAMGLRGAVVALGTVVALQGLASLGVVAHAAIHFPPPSTPLGTEAAPERGGA